MGKDEIADALERTRHNTRLAKNVIIFIGDGMSNPTLTAARIYKGQQIEGDEHRAEKSNLFFERLPHMGHSKVNHIFL